MADFVINNGEIVEYNGNTATVVIPNGVLTVGEYAFSVHDEIETVIIPESVTLIDSSAFYYCENMVSITILGETVSFGRQVFERCSRLQYVVAPNVIWDDIIGQGIAFPAAMGYVKNPYLYSNPRIIGAYNKYLGMQKKRIVPALLKEDYVGGIELFARLEKITKDNFDTDFFEVATAFKAQQCIDFLLDWKRKKLESGRFTPQDPFSISALRKVWGFSKCTDGTLWVDDYKGDATNFSVPGKIGKHQVGGISRYAFSPNKDRRQKSRKVVFYKLRSVEIPDGVKTIMPGAFEGCTLLERVVIPRSVISIGDDAFSQCYKVVIHTQMGSYAEQYALAQNIPVVIIDPA